MKKNRSVCPIASALDLFGDKWTLVIIRDFFAGKKLYSEFLDSPEKISTNILSNRLKLLESYGIIKSGNKNHRTGKNTYHLTATGEALYPVLDKIADWSLTHIKGTKKLIEVPLQSLI